LQKIDGYTEQLQQMGVEVVYGPTPFTEFIENYGKFYDFVMLSRPRIGANFIELCQAYCTKAKIVYDTVDLHYLRLRRQAEYEEGELSDYYAKISKEHEIIEKDLMESADTTLVVSEVEAKMLEKDGFENVEVISNIHSIVPVSYKKVFSDRNDLIFIGGYAHHPNIDGVKWFVDEIFPLVQAKQPHIKIHVVGSNMPSDLKEYLSQKDGVIIDGFVDDATLVELLSSSRVFVAPMRYGAGVKGKVGQAIEHGTPVVCTAIAAEGMYLKDGVSALIADEPEAFASKIVSLYTNEALWIQVQKNAKEVVKNNFSKDAARKVFKRIMKS
jgi:glycosyltransferase involved in cell wall biosynthesis